MTEIGTALDQDFIVKTNGPAERRAAVSQLLRDRRMLLIWDNFESVFSMPDPGRTTPAMGPEERALVSSFLIEVMTHAQSGIIITSRNDEAWLGSSQYPIRRLRLAGLRREDAVEFADSLLDLYPGSVAARQHPDFEALLHWVDGHPLSLRLLLPQLEHKHPSQLLEELRGLSDHLPEGFIGPDRLRSLSVCIKYSLDHLDPSMHDRLFVLSLFEGVVNADVLAEFSGIDGIPAHFSVLSLSQWLAALDQLAATGLLSPMGLGMYQLHPALPAYLTADWRASARASYESERAAVEGAMLLAYSRFANWVQNEINCGRAEIDSSGLDWQWHTMGSFVSTALRLSQYVEARALLQPMMWYFEIHGLVEESRNWMMRCLREVEGHARGARDVPALETPAGALWYYAWEVLGGIAFNENLNDARKLYERLRERLETLPQSLIQQHYLGVIYAELAKVFLEMDESGDAWVMALKALEIAEARQDEAEIAIAHHYIGSIAMSRNDLETADGAARNALEIFERLGDVANCGVCHYQLGLVAQQRGDGAEALRQYDVSYETERAVGNLPNMATMIYQMGRVALVLEHDLDAAEKYYRESLLLCESLGNNRGIAMSSDQLGEIAQLRNDVGAADAWYRKSLALWESLEDRARIALTCTQLADTARKRGDESAAERWSDRVRGDREE